MNVSGQLHSLLTLIPGKSPRYPLHRLRGGPYRRSEHFRTELNHTPQSRHYFDAADSPNFILSPVNQLNVVCVCVCVCVCVYIYIYIYIYTGSAKKMYTHFNRRFLCIVFEVGLNFHYNM
jgi:hypothetical protein